MLGLLKKIFTSDYKRNNILAKQKEYNLYSKYLPWLTMNQNGVVLTKDGLLQKTYSFTGPDLSTQTNNSANIFSEQITNILNRLSDKVAIYVELQKNREKQLPFHNLENPLTNLLEFERYSLRSSTCNLSTQYFLTLLYLPPRDLSQKVSNFFYEKDNLVPSNDSIKDFNNICNDFILLLRNHLNIKNLSPVETLNYLHSTVSLNADFSFTKEQLNCFFIDKLLVDQTLDNGDILKLGDYYIQTLTCKGFPPETVPGILDFLNHCNIEFRWVSRLKPYSKIQASKIIKKTTEALFGKRQNVAKEFSAMFASDSKEHKPEVDADIASIENEKLLFHNDVVSYGSYSSFIMIYDEDINKLRTKSAEIKSKFIEKNFPCVVDDVGSWETFFAMMPGNPHLNKNSFMLNSIHTANLLQFTSLWDGESENLFFKKEWGESLPNAVFTTSSGSLFNFNLNNASSSTGDIGHFMVLGPTGSGKSTLLYAIVQQFTRYQKHNIIVFDVDESLTQYSMAHGGDVFIIGDTNLSFQPLRELENEEDLIWANDFILLLLDLQGITITVDIKNSVSDTLKQMSSLEKDLRSLSTFSKFVQYRCNINNNNIIREALKDYINMGKYGHIFDSEKASWSFEKNNNLIMFEMRKVIDMGDKVALPTLQYLLKIINPVLKSPVPTLLILDEVWSFLSHPFFANTIKDWLKTLRKSRVFVGMATQEVADIFNSSISTTLLQQCYTKIFLADEDALDPSQFGLYEKMGLHRNEISTLRNMQKKKHYFYKNANGSRVFELGLSQFALSVYTGIDKQILKSWRASYDKKQFLDLILNHQNQYEYVDTIMSHYDVYNSNKN